MKSIKITLILLIITTVANAQLKVGGKLSYGSKIESLGFGAKAIYELNENFSLSGELNYFFGITTTTTNRFMGQNFSSSEVDTGLVTLNTDLHYNINISNSNDLRFYGIGGLNFSFYGTEVTTDKSFTGSTSANNNETFIGLNLGFGGGFSITDKLDLISELKYIISDLNQIVFSSGVVYSLN